jgi:signal transduction histidine kinase
LMEGLLSLAQSGTIERPAKFVSTDEVVATVIKTLETNISASGAILQINPLPPIHIPKTFLAQIFDNLIGNALRYAGNSGDPIEVGGEQAGKQIRFFVRDHGPGISEQERKHIFEIFYRGTNKGEVKGSGIGLAIVYKIARNYGGRAWVEETPGGGCTFWVEVEDVAQT